MSDLEGRGWGWGGISIVSALATGKGATLAVGMGASCRARLDPQERGVEVVLLSHPKEDPALLLDVLRRYKERVSLEGGLLLEVDSNVPPSRGLKSSSAVTVGALLACRDLSLKIQGRGLDDEEILRIAVDSSLALGVSLTGSLDDSSASLWGGIVVTDNSQGKVEGRIEPPPGRVAVIWAPPGKRRAGEVRSIRFEGVRKEIEEAHALLRQQRDWKSAMEAMTRSGLAMAAALGGDPRIVREALERGAEGAGVSGKGPSVAAVVPKGSERAVVELFRSWGEGEILVLPLVGRGGVVLE